MPPLILASGSPRRQELLDQVGIDFEVIKPDVDESVLSETDPQNLVEALAILKGEAIEITGDQVLISADTVVSYDGRILTKPANEEDAFNMLSQLRATRHDVYTGVMIRSLHKQVVFSNQTSVTFWDVSDLELRKYLTTDEWRDKAAGYGIQSRGAFLVKEISGDFYNVVGLPISEVVRRLQEFHIYPN